MKTTFTIAAALSGSLMTVATVWLIESFCNMANTVMERTAGASRSLGSR